MAKTGSSYLREAAYLPSIVGVAALSDFLRLLLDDGTAGDVDFSDEVWEGVLESRFVSRCTSRSCALTPRPERSHGRKERTWPRSLYTSKGRPGH